MLAALALVVLAQAPRVAVVDVSAPDAVYEDVSRELAEEVVASLSKAGFDAIRVDETEIPGGKRCPIGPCLGQVAKMVGAHVVVALDAAEVKTVLRGGNATTDVQVSLTALLGINGEPLCAKRYFQGKKDTAKLLGAFTRDLSKIAAKRFPPRPDAGVR